MSSPLAPRLWGVHALGVAAIVAASGLGMWQLDSWQAQRAAEASDLTRLDPEPLAEVIGADDRFPGDKVGQPVVVSGVWVPDGTVYVSGRELDGRDGYWVVTPLAIGPVDAADEPGAGDAPALPIVRGWTADPAEAPAPPEGAAEMVAWLQPAEGTGEADTDRSDDIIPQVRTADLIQRVDQDLYGAYGVVATDVAPGDWPTGDTAVNDGTEGLSAATLEQLPAADRFTGLRNFLYALEWWIFAAFAAFVWWRYVREVTAEPEDEAEPLDEDGQGDGPGGDTGDGPGDEPGGDPAPGPGEPARAGTGEVADTDEPSAAGAGTRPVADPVPSKP